MACKQFPERAPPVLLVLLAQPARGIPPGRGRQERFARTDQIDDPQEPFVRGELPKATGLLVDAIGFPRKLPK